MKRLMVAGTATMALALTTLAAFDAAAQMSAEQVAAAVGFESGDKAKVLAGKVVAVDLPETTDSMLSQAIAALIRNPPSDIATTVLEGEAYKVDRDTLGFGAIDPNNIEGSLAAAKFTAEDAAEVEKLRGAKPGSEFNFSTEEFAKVKAAVAAGASSPEQMSKLYQEILAARVTAYAQGGISAIAPYDRGGSKVSPAADLKAATVSSKVLQEFLPDLYKAFLNYPNDKLEGVEERFLWLKQMVEKRPTFVLEHRIVYKGPDITIGLGRQFYVGQSYDAAQFTAGAFPTDKGTLILYGNHTMTDQVAGFMQGTRHSVGRGMMRDELVAHFQALQKKYK